MAGPGALVPDAGGGGSIPARTPNNKEPASADDASR